MVIVLKIKKRKPEHLAFPVLDRKCCWHNENQKLHDSSTVMIEQMILINARNKYLIHGLESGFFIDNDRRNE